MKTTALLLAAGESARMGTPKALLEWGGRPLLGHQLAVLQKSRVDECIVVLGREAARLSGVPVSASLTYSRKRQAFTLLPART